jgi:hypothetical protein
MSGEVWKIKGNIINWINLCVEAKDSGTLLAILPVTDSPEGQHHEKE